MDNNYTSRTNRNRKGDREMKCPFKSSGNVEPGCDKEDCGIWDKSENCCAIVAISQKLTAFTGYNIAETIDRKLDRR
jgi:hypothetical protein